MNESKYLKAFQRLEEAKMAFDIPGDGILVENIKEEEVKTKSGLVISSASGYKIADQIAANLPKFVHVLAKGKGYYNDETGDDVPLSVNPGDIILVGQASVRWFGSLPIDGYEPFSIGVTLESEAQIKFQGIEKYRETFRILNQPAEIEVAQ